MKTLIIVASVLFTALCACQNMTVGYLITENASYNPDTLIIPKDVSGSEYAVRVQNNSPWQTLYLQGYEGTEPITFEVEAVTSTAGEEAAQVFKNELVIRGKGYMNYPLKNNAVPGKYRVSIRLTNSGYSQVMKDAYTFIVVE